MLHCRKVSIVFVYIIVFLLRFVCWLVGWLVLVVFVIPNHSPKTFLLFLLLLFLLLLFYCYCLLFILATVMRFVKDRLPNLRCAQDTKALLLDAAVEFVTLCTSEAGEVADSRKKNTIMPEHLVSALKELGFESYVPGWSIYFCFVLR